MASYAYYHESDPIFTDTYFDQLAKSGFTKEERINYKKFLKEYEGYKNLFNKRARLVFLRDRAP